MPPARLERQSLGANRTLRVMIISLSALVALLMPIVHRNTTTRGHEVNRRYEVMRIEDNALEEEKLFDDGMKPIASGSGDRDVSPATKSRSIWTKHEDVSKKYHVILTSQSSDYLNWQSLVMYYHYKKQREAGGSRGWSRGAGARTTSQTRSRRSSFRKSTPKRCARSTRATPF